MESTDIKDDITLPRNEREPGDDIITPESILRYLKSVYQRLRSNQKVLLIVRGIIPILASFAAALFVSYFLLFMAPALKELPGVRNTEVTNDEKLKKDPLYRKQISQLNRDIQRLSRKYGSYTSGQSYIVINTTDNRFFLYRNKKLIREGFCSSGSYKIGRASCGVRVLI